MPRARSRSAVRPGGVGRQLVVRAAADDAHLQGLDGVVVEGAAEGVGAVDVEVLAGQRPGVVDGPDRRAAPDSSERTASSETSVTTTSAPSSSEVLGEPPADLADPGDADRAAGERRLAPAVLRGRPHPLEDAPGGEDRGVARAAVLGGATGGPAGLLADDVHVGDVGPDVARGDVPAAEGLDEPAVGPQQLGGLVAGGVADDDGLAAAVVEPGEGVLARHRPGQAQDVGERVVHRGVRVEAGAAERRPEGRVVQGDDGAQPGLRVAAEDDLLVAREVDEVGGHAIHASPRLGRRTRCPRAPRHRSQPSRRRCPVGRAVSAASGRWAVRRRAARRRHPARCGRRHGRCRQRIGVRLRAGVIPVP